MSFEIWDTKTRAHAAQSYPRGRNHQGKRPGKGNRGFLMDSIRLRRWVGLGNLLVQWSGRRGSNPRRPAWEIALYIANKEFSAYGANFRSTQFPEFPKVGSGAFLMEPFWSQRLCESPLHPRHAPFSFAAHHHSQFLDVFHHPDNDGISSAISTLLFRPMIARSPPKKRIHQHRYAAMTRPQPNKLRDSTHREA